MKKITVFISILLLFSSCKFSKCSGYVWLIEYKIQQPIYFYFDNSIKKGDTVFVVTRPEIISSKVLDKHSLFLDFDHIEKLHPVSKDSLFYHLKVVML